MKFQVQEGTPLPGMGLHKAKVIAVGETVSPSKYAGPQLQVTWQGVDENFLIRQFYNLVGYERNEDGSVKEDKNGKAVISKERTEKALSKLGSDAFRLGLGKGGEEIDAKDMIGAEGAILVEPNINNNPEVTKVYSLEYAEETLGM